jgi:D-alanyl-D-alanine dipeptidase
MTTQEAASTMKIMNFMLGIGTLDVNRCYDMVQLDTWFDGVSDDINYLNDQLRLGRETEGTASALRLQKVLLQQIKNRQKFLHELYQPIIDYFRQQYPQEYNSLL